MATVAQLSTRIKARLARRTGTSIDSLILAELTAAQQDILEQSATLPNFLKATVTFTIAIAHSSINLVTQAEFARFLRPISKEETAALEYLDTSSGFYVKIPRYDSLSILEQNFNGPGTVPLGYYWDGNVVGSFLLKPEPAGSVSYRARFYRADSSLPDATASTLWTTHAGDYLMHTAGVELATFLRDTDALSYFSSKRQEAHQRFLSQITAQEMADLDLAMGD